MASGFSNSIGVGARRLVTVAMNNNNNHHKYVTQQQRWYASTTPVYWGSPQRRRETTMTSRQRQQQQEHRKVTAMVDGKIIPLHMKDLVSSSSQQQQQSHRQLHSSYHHYHNELSHIKRRRYESDLVVILDMDECLIHSQFLGDTAQSAQVYAHQLLVQRQQQNNSNHSSSSSSRQKGEESENKQHRPYRRPLVADSVRLTLPMGEELKVHLRPGLHDFLQKVCQTFETHIFTAAVPYYADPVLDILDPTRQLFAGRWYRDSCTYDDNQKAYFKNLDLLKVKMNHQRRKLQQQQSQVHHLVDDDCSAADSSLHRMVLVDNNPLSFWTHPQNGILVDSWYHDAHDTALPTVWNLLQQLQQHDTDVRPLLSQQQQQQQEDPQSFLLQDEELVLFHTDDNLSNSNGPTATANKPSSSSCRSSATLHHQAQAAASQAIAVY